MVVRGVQRGFQVRVPSHGRAEIATQFLNRERPGSGMRPIEQIEALDGVAFAASRQQAVLSLAEPAAEPRAERDANFAGTAIDHTLPSVEDGPSN